MKRSLLITLLIAMVGLNMAVSAAEVSYDESSDAETAINEAAENNFQYNIYGATIGTGVSAGDALIKFEYIGEKPVSGAKMMLALYKEDGTFYKMYMKEFDSDIFDEQTKRAELFFEYKTEEIFQPLKVFIWDDNMMTPESAVYDATHRPPSAM